MNKKLIINIFVLMVVFSLMLPIASAYAIDDYSSSQQVYVHDLADLLSDSEESELKTLAQSFCDDCEYEFNVLFLTTSNANGKSTMDYSDDYMDALFPIDVDDNIAFVIDMDNRECYINTMGIAIVELSDYEIETALDKAYGHLTSQDYFGAFKKAANYCLSNMVNESVTSEPGFFDIFLPLMLSNALWALIITAIVVFVLIKKHNAMNKSQSATKYLSNENYEVIDKDEIFVRSYDTVQKDYYKPQSSSSGSSSSRSGGGSSHRSSSGRSHGGGGRKF